LQALSGGITHPTLAVGAVEANALSDRVRQLEEQLQELRASLG
jgi:hypothetical protein